MIDFACKRFDIDEIIRCSLGLTKSEYKIFIYLLENSKKEFRSNEISKKLNLDITTIQKAVKKLFEKNLLERHQKNLEKGGYSYTYKIKHRIQIRNAIKDIIKKWSERVEERIDKW